MGPVPASGAVIVSLSISTPPVQRSQESFLLPFGVCLSLRDPLRRPLREAGTRDTPRKTAAAGSRSPPRSGGGEGLILREPASVAKWLAERQACARTPCGTSTPESRKGGACALSHRRGAISECKDRDTLARSSGPAVQDEPPLVRLEARTDLLELAAALHLPGATRLPGRSWPAPPGARGGPLGQGKQCPLME